MSWNCLGTKASTLHIFHHCSQRCFDISIHLILLSNLLASIYWRVCVYPYTKRMTLNIFFFVFHYIVLHSHINKLASSQEQKKKRLPQPFLRGLIFAYFILFSLLEYSKVNIGGEYDMKQKPRDCNQPRTIYFYIAEIVHCSRFHTTCEILNGFRSIQDRVRYFAVSRVVSFFMNSKFAFRLVEPLTRCYHAEWISFISCYRRIFYYELEPSF